MKTRNNNLEQGQRVKSFIEDSANPSAAATVNSTQTAPQKAAVTARSDGYNNANLNPSFTGASNRTYNDAVRFKPVTPEFNVNQADPSQIMTLAFDALAAGARNALQISEGFEQGPVEDVEPTAHELLAQLSAEPDKMANIGNLLMDMRGVKIGEEV